jgi:hypothetical protein
VPIVEPGRLQRGEVMGLPAVSRGDMRHRWVDPLWYRDIQVVNDGSMVRVVATRPLGSSQPSWPTLTMGSRRLASSHSWRETTSGIRARWTAAGADAWALLPRFVRYQNCLLAGRSELAQGLGELAGDLQVPAHVGTAGELLADLIGGDARDGRLEVHRVRQLGQDGLAMSSFGPKASVASLQPICMVVSSVVARGWLPGGVNH